MSAIETAFPRDTSVRQTRTMAVLFADITGSTRIYSTLGDVAARALIDRALALMLDVVPRHSGRLIKTIGDEVMCGFPTADQAVLAASEMQNVIADRPPDAYPLSIHVGLHYGPVLVEGDDVFGDTVNVAAYLCAVASAEQILMTEVTERCLSPDRQATVRPVFYAVLKGNTHESTVYQILWRPDNFELTDVNLRRRNVIPADLGSLRLNFGDLEICVDQQRTSVQLGRDPACDVRVEDRFASRTHACISVQRTHFYLMDQSINGTFVELESGEEVHVLRSELMLDGSGRISLGRSFSQDPKEIIEFSRDRRSLYRIGSDPAVD